MQNNKIYVKNRLKTVLFLLLLTSFFSCATAKKQYKRNSHEGQIDSVEIFISTHPPIVVPHSWQKQVGL